MRMLRRVRVSVSRTVVGFGLAVLAVGAFGGVALGSFASGWSGGAGYKASDTEAVGRYAALAGNARDRGAAGDGSLFDASYDGSGPGGAQYADAVDCSGCGPTLEERRARAMGYDAQVLGYERAGGYDPDADARRVTAYLAQIDAEEAAARRRERAGGRAGDRGSDRAGNWRGDWAGGPQVQMVDADDAGTTVTVTRAPRVVRTVVTTVTTSSGDTAEPVEP